MKKLILVPTLMLCLIQAPGVPAADLFERLGLRKRDKSAGASALTALSNEDVASGLKEALGKGVQQAVGALGREDGFLKDSHVRIPLPQSLQKAEKLLRTLRQEQLADQFVTTMNRAAEKAVPEAAAVLGDSVKQMTLTDAKTILTGTNNAATQYFRRTSETNLFERFLPIVQQATAQTGVTSAYKQMVGKAGFATALLGSDVTDLDAYVTRKTLDGLFVKIEDEEKRIRENPAARTTELLQKVFGTLRK